MTIVSQPTPRVFLFTEITRIDDTPSHPVTSLGINVTSMPEYDSHAGNAPDHPKSVQTNP